MNFFDAADTLPAGEHYLHQLHFMLCSFAVLFGCLPLAMAKGTLEHRAAGLVYVLLSSLGMMLAAVMAWREASFLLFCFSGFCAWLLLSGWRAAHDRGAIRVIDWAIPSGLMAMAAAVTLHALATDEGTRSLSLLFFACSAFYLGGRDILRLYRRRRALRNQIVLAGIAMLPVPATAWLNRHVAGMIGSMLANLSVVALTLLPLPLHWLWPAALGLAGVVIYLRERQKKQRVAEVLAPVLKPGFRRGVYTVRNERKRRAA